MRTFYVYKKMDGKPERIRLGTVEELTVDDARKATAAKIGKYASGENPQEAGRRKATTVTLGELWTYYLEHHAKPRKKSWRDDEKRFNRHLQGWKPCRLAEITSAEIQALVNHVGDKSGFYEANRLRSLLHKMFALSRHVGYEGRNPVHGIERFPEESRERFLHADELPKFFAALTELRASSPTAADALELCVWTAARKGNVVSMEWSELNLDRAVWIIPGRKFKNGKDTTIPLVAQALTILNRRKATSKSDFVFPGRRHGQHIMDLTRPWKTLLASAGLDGVRVHDLRRTAGAWLASTGASLPQIGKALGHRSTAATMVYARLDVDPIRQAMMKSTSAIQAATEAKSEGNDNESHG